MTKNGQNGQKQRALARALAAARRAGDEAARVRIALADTTDLGTDRTWLDAASIGETEKALDAAMLQLASALDTLTPGSRRISTHERVRRALGFYPVRGKAAGTVRWEDASPPRGTPGGPGWKEARR